jgi:hypothetical protein
MKPDRGTRPKRPNFSGGPGLEEALASVEERRERARRFLENFNAADSRVFEELITEDFTFEIVSSMREFPPIKGRREFAETESATLRRLFPQGLKLELEISSAKASMWRRWVIATLSPPTANAPSAPHLLSALAVNTQNRRPHRGRLLEPCGSILAGS